MEKVNWNERNERQVPLCPVLQIFENVWTDHFPCESTVFFAFVLITTGSPKEY